MFSTTEVCEQLIRLLERSTACFRLLIKISINVGAHQCLCSISRTSLPPSTDFMSLSAFKRNIKWADLSQVSCFCLYPQSFFYNYNSTGGRSETRGVASVKQVGFKPGVKDRGSYG